MIHLKSEAEIEQMAASGVILAGVLDELESLIRPGISTFEIDKFAEMRCKELEVKPAFKGYHGFPRCVCISVNEEVVHGIPSPKRVLVAGDLVSLDFGVILNGWFSDSARTLLVGGSSSADIERLVSVTRKSLELGIAECQVGGHLYDIGAAIQNYVEAAGFSIVREFVGHGIGRALHEDPQVPNFGVRGKGAILKAGMVLAIEPMVNMGKPAVKVLKDGWTAVTVDRSWSAHFEHTVAITDRGPRILTLKE